MVQQHYHALLNGTGNSYFNVCRMFKRKVSFSPNVVAEEVTLKSRDAEEIFRKEYRVWLVHLYLR